MNVYVETKIEKNERKMTFRISSFVREQTRQPNQRLDAIFICYYIVFPWWKLPQQPWRHGRLSPPSRKITDELVLTNDLAMTLDSLDSLDGPTEADLFGDDDDIFGEQWD